MFGNRHVSRRSTAVVGVTAALLTGLLAAIGAANANAGSVSAGTYSLFDKADVTKVSVDPETTDVELGMRFTVSQSGTVSAIRFLKAPGDINTRAVTLWSATGTKVASATSTNESASGWQTVNLSTPATLKSGSKYVVSYHAQRYMATENYFNKAVNAGPLKASANRNGVYSYGAGFPTQSYKSSNYWVDVVFNVTGPVTNPVTSTTSPSTSTSTTTGETPTTVTPTPVTPTPVTPTTSAPTTTTTVKTTTTTQAPTTTTTAPPTGDAAPAVAPPNGKAWNLAFAEEFNGTDYDHKKLTPCFDWNYGDCTKTFNTGLEVYKPEQVRVANGIASLVAEPMTPAVSSTGCFGGSCTYKSGLLSTARPNASDGSPYLYTFTYGYVESRMKIPNTQGFFTAFWMLPADPSFSYRSEIDILENLGGDPKSMFMTYHYDDRGQSFPVNNGQYNNGACAAKDYSTDYHNIGVDWQADHIAWYIDGVKCGQFTNAAQIENGPMQIILNQMVNVQWQRDWKVGLTNPSLSSSLNVDYIRVYQAK